MSSSGSRSTWSRCLPERLIVNAPASSANLGPGFDCLAVALELRNRVEISATGGETTTVTAEGEGASRLPANAGENLFVRAFTATGADPRGLTMHMTNAVPFAKGLGSSAATIAAGVLAGLAWQGDDRDPFPLAVELEGHPDNVAAALFGGVQLSWKSSRGPPYGGARLRAGRVHCSDPAVRALHRAGSRGHPAAGAGVRRGAYRVSGGASGGGDRAGEGRSPGRCARRPPA